MDNQPYPLPRQMRETDIMVGDGGATYGPFSFKIFDESDVTALICRDGETAFTVAAVTATKVAGLPFDDFTVIFEDDLTPQDRFVIQSSRLHERQVAITRGGAISGQELEKELSKQGVVIQELRRDMALAVRLPPTAKNGDGILDQPVTGRVIGWDENGRLVSYINSAAEAEAEATAAKEYRNESRLAKEQAEFYRNEASGFADDSSGSASSASIDADRAELAAGNAFVNADVYPDVASGLAATTVGDQFQVVAGKEIIRYRHDAGPVAVEVASYPSAGAVRSIHTADPGVQVYRAFVPVLNGTPASTFEAGGIVAVPVNGTPWFDIDLSPELSAALIADQCDVAVVRAADASLVGATLEQFAGASSLGVAVSLVSDGAGGFILQNVTVDATATRFRIRLSNTAGSGTARVFYPEVRRVSTPENLSTETLDFAGMASAQIDLLTAEPVNIAAQGPSIDMRRLAGAGSVPTYNAATGAITVAADVLGEIVYLVGTAFVGGDTITVSARVTGDDTLTGPLIEVIPVRAIDHSTGAGAATRMLRGADGYWTAVLAATDADGNTPASIVIRPDTRASGQRNAKAVVIDDVWIGKGLVRYRQSGLTAALDALAARVSPVATTAEDAEALALKKSRALASLNARFTAHQWVANSGSDVAAGTEEAPKATLAAALAVVTAGQQIALRGGENHTIATALIDGAVTNVSLVGIGTEPAVIDGRQHITGAWTATAGRTGVYEKTVTFRETTVNAGVNTSTWNYAAWLGETDLVWRVGGASIAANLDQVEATPGSFTIHRTGSTVQDPRSDTNATGYTIYVHLPDSSDPTGQDVSTADLAVVIQLIGGTHENIEIKGGAWKDFAKSAESVGAIPPVLRNYRSLGGGQHQWVGPCTLSGVVVLCQPKGFPGVSGATRGRGNGGAMNIFTNTARALDLVWDVDTLDTRDSLLGLYGHGTGSYRSLQIPGVHRARNCGAALTFLKDSAPTVPFFAGGVTLGEVDYVDVDEAFDCDSDLTVGGGAVELSVTSFSNSGNRTGLVKLSKSGVVQRFIGVGWRFNDLRTSGAITRYLYWRTFSGGTDPTLHLTGCRDLSLPGRTGRIFGTGNASAAHLILDGGTVVGDLVGTFVATGFTPASLTVGPGCTFGVAGMTRAAMRTYFDGLSIPHSISDDTTVVGPWGEVVEMPA